MYVFSFEITLHNEIQGNLLTRYKQWWVQEERVEDDTVIEVIYMFDDSTAEELASEIGDDERFGGYYPLGARLV